MFSDNSFSIVMSTPNKTAMRKKNRKKENYIHIHTLTCWTERTKWHFDSWERVRLSSILLFFSVNHNGKQHTCIAIAIMISKWRWSRLMPFSLSLYRLGSWIKRRGERERKRGEEYFNLSWHTDALFLTFFFKREKKESESE